MENKKFIKAIKYLHSSAENSTEKLRAMLNKEILKHYDKTKIIKNHLDNQIDSLQDHDNMDSELKEYTTKKAEELKLPTSGDNQQIARSIDIDEDSSSDDNDFSIDLTDLSCLICKQVNSSTNNQLFECIDCNQLFHQLCHSPKIKNDTDPSSWRCCWCQKMKQVAAKYDSSSSGSHKCKDKERIKKREKSRSEKRKFEESEKSKSKKKSKESSSSSRANKK